MIVDGIGEVFCVNVIGIGGSIYINNWGYGCKYIWW